MIKFSAILSLLVLAGCSSYPDVRPGVDGLHSIAVRGEDVTDTEGDAYRQAKAFCRDRKMQAAFVSDETFKATPHEQNLDINSFKEKLAVITDLKFTCI